MGNGIHGILSLAVTACYYLRPYLDVRSGLVQAAAPLPSLDLAAPLPPLGSASPGQPVQHAVVCCGHDRRTVWQPGHTVHPAAIEVDLKQ